MKTVRTMRRHRCYCGSDLQRTSSGGDSNSWPPVGEVGDGGSRPSAAAMAAAPDADDDETISYREWVRMCRVIMSRRHAAYGHCGHLYGFSPVCVRWCVLKWSDRENTCPHTRHVYGLTPVCSRMCRVSMSLRANDRLHTSHGYALAAPPDESPLPPFSVDEDAAVPVPADDDDADAEVLCRDAMCLASRSCRLNIWPHTGHTYATSEPTGISSTTGDTSRLYRTATEALVVRDATSPLTTGTV